MVRDGIQTCSRVEDHEGYCHLVHRDVQRVRMERRDRRRCRARWPHDEPRVGEEGRQGAGDRAEQLP